MACSIFSEEGANFRRLKKDDLAKYRKPVIEIIWFKISNKTLVRCDSTLLLNYA